MGLMKKGTPSSQNLVSRVKRLLGKVGVGIAWAAALGSIAYCTYSLQNPPKLSPLEKQVVFEVQHNPNFIPGTRRIVLASEDESTGNTDLFSYDLTTNSAINLTNNPEVEWHGYPSPDSSLMLYSVFDGKNLTYTLLNMKRKQEKDISASNLSSPSWSPDSRRICFYQDNRMVVLDTANNELVDIHSANKIVRPKSFKEKWSPDGKMIVFMDPKQSKRTIFSYNFETGTTSTIDSNSDINDFEVLGDGRIAYCASSGKENSIWISGSTNPSFSSPNRIRIIGASPYSPSLVMVEYLKNANIDAIHERVYSLTNKGLEELLTTPFAAGRVFWYDANSFAFDLRSVSRILDKGTAAERLEDTIPKSSILWYNGQSLETVIGTTQGFSQVINFDNELTFLSDFSSPVVSDYRLFGFNPKSKKIFQIGSQYSDSGEFVSTLYKTWMGYSVLALLTIPAYLLKRKTRISSPENNLFESYAAEVDASISPLERALMKPVDFLISHSSVPMSAIAVSVPSYYLMKHFGYSSFSGTYSLATLTKKLSIMNPSLLVPLIGSSFLASTALASAIGILCEIFRGFKKPYLSKFIRGCYFEAMARFNKSHGLPFVDESRKAISVLSVKSPGLMASFANMRIDEGDFGEALRHYFSTLQLFKERKAQGIGSYRFHLLSLSEIDRIISNYFERISLKKNPLPDGSLAPHLRLQFSYLLRNDKDTAVELGEQACELPSGYEVEMNTLQAWMYHTIGRQDDSQRRALKALDLMINQDLLQFERAFESSTEVGEVTMSELMRTSFIVKRRDTGFHRAHGINCYLEQVLGHDAVGTSLCLVDMSERFQGILTPEQIKNQYKKQFYLFLLRSSGKNLLEHLREGPIDELVVEKALDALLEYHLKATQEKYRLPHHGVTLGALDYQAQFDTKFVARLGPKYSAEFRASLSEGFSPIAKYLSGRPRFFIHGDLHPGNVIYDQSTRKVSIIDSEDACLGSFGVDISAFTGFNGMPNPNVARYAELLSKEKGWSIEQVLIDIDFSAALESSHYCGRSISHNYPGASFYFDNTKRAVDSAVEHLQGEDKDKVRVLRDGLEKIKAGS